MIWLLLFCQLWSQGLAHPRPLYHERSSIWFNESSSFNVPDPYFGFSITYLPSSQRLIVSAPQADNIGNVYSCNIRNKTCSKMMRGDIQRHIDKNGGNYTNNYWYGAVVKAGPTFLLACAPLYTSTAESRDDRPGTYGYCNVYTDPESPPRRLKTLSMKDRVTGERIYMHEHEIDTLGWSIDVVDNKAIIGGPAMFTGRAVTYNNINSGNSRSMTGYNTQILYNFGYSVAIGKFLSNSDELMYAVASTFGRTGIGKVAFYRPNKKPQPIYLSNTKFEMQELVGSMYGAVLCAAKLIQGRDKSALLVGAPTYAMEHTYNLGAVFVYLPVKNKITPEYHKKIVGKDQGSYFGGAIVSVGDLNGDRIDEIAIGAPYENDGRGAVYLYSGADISGEKSEDSLYWMQRIVASSALSFGLSLTPLQDYSDNGCNELAIGAPQSNAVMVLNCIATAIVQIYAEIPPNLQDLKIVSPDIRNETHFKFQSCFVVNYPDKPKTVLIKLNVSVNIIHPDAKIVHPEDKVFTVILKGEKRFCRNIVVGTPELGNYGIPLHYELKATQLESPIDRDVFDPSRLAVSELSTMISSGRFSINECKDQNCTVDMRYMGTQFDGIYADHQYVIGSSERVNMSVRFYNAAETAYDACVFVDVTSASVLRPSSECVRTDTRLKCAPVVRLKTNDTWNTGVIPLSTAELTSADDKIVVTIALFDQCSKSETLGQTPKLYSEVIHLLTNSSGVKIRGITDSGKDNYVNATADEIQQGKYFQQTYTITNSGPTSWVNVVATLEVEKKHFINNNNNTVTLIIKDEMLISPMECTMTSDTKEKYVYNCYIDKLTKNTVTASISISFYIIANEFEEAVSKDETMTTRLQIDLNGEIKSYTIVNNFLMIKPVWELWMILVAVLLGLLLLIILIVILSKRGFLQRKNRQQLAEVERSVKRQTMQRKSMASSHRNADEENLLDISFTAKENSKKRIRINSEDCDGS